MGVIIKEKYLNILSIFFFAIIVFFLTRQIPFGSYSFISNISIIGLMSLTIYQIRKKGREIFLMLLWTFSLFAYSLIMQNELSNIVRFSVIFISVLLSYYVKLPSKALNIVFFFTILQALFLIGFQIYLLIFLTIDTYMPIRFFFRDIGWGDIYTYSGSFYFIQIKGNALLPFMYMLTYLYPFNKSYNKWFSRIIFLLGTVCGGNFAFFLSIICFHFLRFINFQGLVYKKVIQRLFFLFIAFLLLSSAFFSFVNETLERKSDGSLSTRYDQLNVLMSDLNENISTFLFGQGLGNTVSVQTSSRDYTGDIYFELQSVFFLNQLGFVNFILFVGINIYLAIKKIKNPALLWLYFCYIMYACTNPYLLDTTQCVVIIILISLNSYLKLNENRLCSSLV